MDLLFLRQKVFPAGDDVENSAQEHVLLFGIKMSYLHCFYHAPSNTITGCKVQMKNDFSPKLGEMFRSKILAWNHFKPITFQPKLSINHPLGSRIEKRRRTATFSQILQLPLMFGNSWHLNPNIARPAVCQAQMKAKLFNCATHQSPGFCEILCRP